jgi:phenylpropionate dioxygenase-like ring-hydroxylating dioxygenase large terminal subunit
MARLPAAWDFPLGSADRLDLVPVQVATWGGFVFINPDLDAPPLAEHLGEMVEHFAPWRFEARYVEAHVAKRCAANWKVVQEAFMESFHVAATHPQQLVRIGDTNSQYDCFGNVNRSIHPSGVASPSVPYVPTQQEMLDAMIDVRLDEASLVTVPDGETMRSFVARVGRDALRPTIGAAADALSDSELVDAIPYWVFPNLHPWAAYQRIVYRFRPDGDDHRRCLMEVMLLSPFVGARPRPAPCHVLDDDEPWASAPELGITGRILDQDVFNLPQVQAGLQLAPVDGLALSSYQESRIRHFHHLLDRYLAGQR